MNPSCLGNDVDSKNIATGAEITGSSFITGRRTRIAAGAKIHNSRLHDVVVEAGATITDSVILAEGEVKSHKCDAAARTVVRGAELPTIGAGASVSGCTLTNTSVGALSVMTDSWAGDCVFGPRCRISQAKIIITNADSDVVVTGPTEISEAWLGHHTVIDRRGYYEGVFSNKFLKLKFDPSAGLKVVGTIDLPHVGRYGVNTINSTNSGKLKPQPDSVMSSFGRPGGLWGGEFILSHEQIELGPCAFVVPWTKVVGQSPAPHATDEELVADELTTYLMPFSMAGYEGDLTRGLVMPGELSVGLGTKQRKGGWVFTYAVDAVINMVARLHDALPADRKGVADTIVSEAISTAVEMTRAMAHKNNVDLSVPAAKQKPGWPRWIAQTWALLQAHIEGDLWQFSGGKPVGWKRDGGKWTHANIARLLAAAPDALENQKSEADLYAFEDPVPPVSVAVPTGGVKGTDGPPAIDKSAKVAPGAIVGPGCRIGPGSVIEAGAAVWNSIIDGSTVASGARVERSVVSGSKVGAGSLVRSSRMANSTLGRDSQVLCAAISNSRLADLTQATAFADVRDCDCRFGTILGGAFRNTTIDCYLMSMHMAGGCFNMKALPVDVQVGGKTFSVPAIPMIGGGSLIRGTADKPVVMQCSFIGSNAIIEPGTYLGLGCFILGTLGPDAGLLPFTVSTGGDATRHQIGAVLTNLPSTIMTHFIAWTFNAAGAELSAAVGEMCRQGIRDGIAAIEYEQARRAGSAVASDAAKFAKYRSLPVYTDDQLASGLALYRKALAGGVWDMTVTGGELKFANAKGKWIERTGSAIWKSTEGI